MPAIGAHSHDLRIPDRERSWRIVYHIAGDPIVILDVFIKKMQAIPANVIKLCSQRLAAYKKAAGNEEHP